MVVPSVMKSVSFTLSPPAVRVIPTELESWQGGETSTKVSQYDADNAQMLTAHALEAAVMLEAHDARLRARIEAQASAIPATPFNLARKPVAMRSQSVRAVPSQTPVPARSYSVRAPSSRPPVGLTPVRTNTEHRFSTFLDPSHVGTLKTSDDMGGSLHPFRHGVTKGWKFGKKKLSEALEKRR
jgi:hypothetical protein